MIDGEPSGNFIAPVIVQGHCEQMLNNEHVFKEGCPGMSVSGHLSKSTLKLHGN